MEKQNKIAFAIIFGMIIFNFFLGFLNFLPSNKQKDSLDDIKRIILFSFDSCNPEYVSPEYMPKLYSLLKEEGIMFKNAWCPLAAETMNGHTTMLTGCWPNSTGILGNSYHNSDLPDDEQPENPVQDRKHRLVNTIFEYLTEKYPEKAKKTAFISGKWRLPDFLAYGAEYVFASPVCKKFDVCPKGYEQIVGTPITHTDGDIYDQWCMRALTELIRRDDPEFIFVNLAWVDAYGHDTGAFNPNYARELKQLDNLIWQFIIDLKAMKKYSSTMFIFTSDHGMSSIKEVFNVEKYLKNNGIDTDYIHIEGHSAFIFLKNKSDTDKAVKILKESDKIAIVLSRKEMNKVHLNTFENRTGQIYISCKEYVAPSIKDLEFASIGTHGGVATRDIPMAFIGAGIKKGEFLQDTIPGLEDLVPTILYIWNYDIPNYVDGRVLNEIFE
ncbi:MAG: alkaline phosphatase family protein [Promethearchaeia archaeon]